MEAVKPLLTENDLILFLSDEIEMIGERYYVRASAQVNTLVGTGNIKVFGYAREAATKKGMDEAQITGAASSYARKYALNGLFLIDDTKDADTNEQKKEADARSEAGKNYWNDYDARTGEWKEETRVALLDMKKAGKSFNAILKGVEEKYKVSKEKKEALKQLLS